MIITLVMLMFLMAFWTWDPARAADIIPPPAQTVPPSSEDPSVPPKNEPDPRDPGMVKQPKTTPHPDSVQTPPVVDPKMAIDPDAPTKEDRYPMLPPANPPPSPKSR